MAKHASHDASQGSVPNNGAYRLPRDEEEREEEEEEEEEEAEEGKGEEEGAL
jgi:hypothetical protein